MIFTKEKREQLQAALNEHKGETYAAIREEALKAGYRLAEVWEREHLAPKDLFSWRGTLWVRLTAEELDHADPTG